MDKFEYYKDVVMNKYMKFDGRARRSEYWYFVLFNIIISVIVGVIGEVIGTNLLSSVYSLAVLLPSIAVGVRRLHDIGKSGWFLLIAFIPLLGAIYLIYLFASDSDAGNNEYGSNPKEDDSDDITLELDGNL